MDKLKKVGVSALAGSLITLSAAQAGGVSISGSYELSYTQLDHDEVAGNKLGMNKNITFGGSGDVTSGGGVTWSSTVAMSDSMGLSSASLAINMGGIATLAYDSGTGGYGANAVDNIVPTAWEEIDAGFSTGLTDVGVVTKSKGVVNFTLKAPGVGSAISLSYVPEIGMGHIADGGTSGSLESKGKGLDAVLDIVNFDMKYAGFRLGAAGEINLKEETCRGIREDSGAHGDVTSCSSGHMDHPYAATAYTKLKLGPLVAGLQATFKDPQDAAASGIADNHSIVGGIAMVFGDTLSVSYGEGIDEYKYNNAARANGERVQSNFAGYSAAYNIGPIALKYFTNEVANQNGVRGTGDKHSEINLSIAF